MNQETMFKIGAVAKLTGINQHLIRLWEKRHGLITPTRSDTGRRLYSQQDIDTLKLVKQLIDGGDSIGQIAHLDAKRLKARLESAFARETWPSSDSDEPTAAIRCAVYGEYLTTRLADTKQLPGNVSIVARETSISGFRQEVRKLKPDALIIETPIFTNETVTLVNEISAESGAYSIVVIYEFAREAAIQNAHQDGIQLLKSSRNLNQIFRMITLDRARQHVVTRSIETASAQSQQTRRLPLRMFDDAELARLANNSTAVECECPHHLVDIVKNLNAFEAYSAACTNTSQEDAELHDYLHRTTAEVRATLEKALEKVAIMEGLL